MAHASNRSDSGSSAPAAENIPAAPANCVASARRENWLRGGQCQPAARIAPRHNVRRHLGSGFLHGVGRHVLPVAPGGNPAWGYPRCCRQDQSRSGQDQIRSELLGLVQSSGQWNGRGTARFAQQDAGQQRPASMGKKLGTWPTSQLRYSSLFVRLCQVLFSTLFFIKSLSVTQRFRVLTLPRSPALALINSQPCCRTLSILSPGPAPTRNLLFARRIPRWPH